MYNYQHGKELPSYRRENDHDIPSFSYDGKRYPADEENTNNNKIDNKEKEKNLGKREDHQDHGFWDVLSFGVGVASSNLYIYWSLGFSSGFWDFFICAILGSVFFISLHLCIAEMVSILPFAGGMYGFARVTCTPYVGFLVGCFESIGNIVYTVVNMIPIGTNITYMTGWDARYEPIYWLIAYMLVIGTECAGRKVFFTFLRCVAFTSVALAIFYIIISIQSVHPLEYIPVGTAAKASLFPQGINDMLPILSVSGFYYYGVEILPLVSDEIRDARKNTPWAIVWTLIIVTTLGFVLMFVAYAQYPSFGDDYVELPLNQGFTYALGIDDQVATILSYPALYISNALFIYGYGKQLKAMAKSRLFPSFLSWTLPNTAVPYMALLFGSGIGYIVLLILEVWHDYSYAGVFVTAIFNTALLGSYTTFIIMFFSYIVFHYKYNNLQRHFRNPFGVVSAVVGMLGIGLFMVSVIGFSNDDYQAFYQYLGFITVASLYYYFYARHHQIFSEDEQSVMFVVYLMKANQQRNQQIKTKFRSKPVKSKNRLRWFGIDQDKSTDNYPTDGPTSIRSVASSLNSFLSSTKNIYLSRQRLHRVYITETKVSESVQTHSITPNRELPVGDIENEYQ